MSNQRGRTSGDSTPAVCTGANGPHDGVAAGCLTRFLGVPWQTDHTSCNSAADYFPSTFLSMPTFWGPRAPDQVLADGNYLRAAAIAPSRPGDATADLQAPDEPGRLVARHPRQRLL